MQRRLEHVQWEGRGVKGKADEFEARGDRPSLADAQSGWLVRIGVCL